MSEYALGQNPELIQAAEQVACVALKSIDFTYGSGMPLWTPGTQELAYHNGHHGRAVQDGSGRMTETVGLTPNEIAVARVAGAGHDWIQLQGRGIDEDESARQVARFMEQTGQFPPELREMAKLAIIGTEPLFDEQYRLIGQRACELDYPSKAAEMVAKSVACADLGELYQPQGPYLGRLLYREILGMPAECDIRPEDMVSFQRNQLFLLENYTYPLAEANHALATHRPQVIAYGHQVLAQLERGDIETWDQLIAQDLRFMAQA